MECVWKLLLVVWKECLGLRDSGMYEKMVMDEMAKVFYEVGEGAVGLGEFWLHCLLKLPRGGKGEDE